MKETQMGFLSGLFGGNKQDKALQEAFEHIKRVLEDEEFQLDLINPADEGDYQELPRV
jgi:hypothetical protein